MTGAPNGPDRDRIDRLRDDIRARGLDGALFGHPPNIRYLCGFSGSSALLLVRRDEARLITDFRYEEQAGAEVAPAVEVVLAREGLIAALSSVVESSGSTSRLGFEPEHVSVADRRELGESCPSVLWEDLPPAVERARARKGPDEIVSIASAVERAERAFEETLPTLREGMTERELAAELDYRLTASSEGPAFETIVASGPRSALPHAQPTTRVIEEGDLVLLDFGAIVDGYRSDMTRTVVLGAARPWQRQIHQAVVEAQEKALSSIASGRPAREVDSAARGHLESLGYGERFGHSVGHGLGLEVHEAPRLYRRSEDTLEAGNVVTVEPGVYLHGEGGVRVEEDVVVEEGGYSVLTSSARDLREL